MSGAPVQRVHFGSSQDRKLFPFYYAPDRLGNQMLRQEAPHLGPGSYENHEFGTMLHTLEKTPASRKGYGLSARTAPRFPPFSSTVTPSPLQYQKDQSQSSIPPPGKTPFNSTAKRFKSKSFTTENSPGPGTYNHDVVTSRKVNWPMCFGRPDWSQLTQLEKKTLRVKLNSEEDFLKHRSRLAYLSLYY
ncbi:hypothetical protein Q5P01_008164 [Channa striata]|uniref:Protein pitchfork n=1 Tax=Channa striata TaxID=64152 RepID=A0AA88N824_CHASR|nr:hypothetical protein Q5P01_008164 [Channa striata]